MGLSLVKSGTFYLFLIFVLSGFSYGQLNLTLEEKQWLKDHPVVKVANEDDWPPFDYSENGKALGLSINYVEILFSKLGVEAEFINGYSWNELLEMSKNYQVDLMPCIWYAEERTQFLKYTTPYINNPQVIVVNKENNSIQKIADLKGRKVAFIDDYATKDKILKAYPEIIPVPVKSPLEALLLVNLGNADACVDSLGSVSYLIDKNLLSGLKIAGRLEMEGIENINNLYMAVRKDWPLFHSALQKAYNSLTDEEKLSLHEKWLLKIESDSKGKFSVLDSEKKWLNENKEVKFGYINHLAPVQYDSISRNFSGITAEYIQQFETTTGEIFTNLSIQDFDSGKQMLKSGEIDVLSTVIDRSEKDLYYTQPFISIPVVILTEKKTSLMPHLSSLQDKKIAIVQGSGIDQKLRTLGEFRKLHFYSTTSEAMEALEKGDVYALCGDLATITYNLQKTGSDKFVIANTTGLTFEIGFAVRPDWKQMGVILDRYIASLTEEKKMAVEHRWFNLFVEEQFTFTSYWKEILGLCFIVIILFSVFILWNRSLAKEIEQRRIVEESLVAARQQAEKSDQAKSEFLAMMSHEIRTPLNGIIGMSELLGDSKLNEEQQKECDIIISSGKSLLTIINDILDFSKIEAGKLEIEKHPFNLASALESVVSLYQNSASTKGLYLKLEMSDKVFGSYRGDEGRLKQVLLNLVSNAIKFTSKGGVTVKVDLLKTEEKRETLQIAVQDTGIGIPKEDQDKLFQKFSQADTSTTRKYGGTGLGLAISKKIIDLMSGTIYLKSEAGKGSSFIIEIILPKAAVQVGKKEKTKTEFPTGTNLNILLAEDNIVNQKISVKVLTKMGCKVDVAGNGREVLEKLAKAKPDLILMDCHMPELDGYQTTIEIRKNEMYNDVPIVAMTANALLGDREKCLSIGMNDYISKPVDKKELVRVLGQYTKATASNNS